MVNFFSLCLVMGLSTAALAAETAKVLPKGIFRARVVGIDTSDITQNYSESGAFQNYSAPLNRSLTTKDFVKQKPELGPLVGALNSLQPGAGDRLINANLYSDFSMNVQTVLPALEYGLTDEVSLGVRAPIVKRKVTANFRAIGVNNGHALLDQGGTLFTPEMNAGLTQVAGLSFNQRFFEESIFTSKGYVVPHDFEKTELGDVEFGAKYNFYKNAGFYATTQLGARAPTGSTQSMTDIYDVGSGGGSWAVGIQMFQEYEVTSYLTFGGSEKFTQNLPDTRARAVPKNADDGLPSLLPQDGQVQDVTRQQPLLVETELSSTFYLMDKSVSFWGAYQYLTKGEDRFTGAGDLYYQGLSTGTAQEKNAGELGVGYSTIPAFRKKQFSVPMELQALYNTTLSGKNVPTMSYGRMDLIVYF